MKIAIADDEPAVRTVLSHHIHVYNPKLYDILTADDGEELITLVEKECPEILFVDIKMPGMTGLESLNLLKEENMLNDSSIYMISGYTDFNYARESMKLGAKDFLPKPIRYSDIEAILSKEEKKRFPGITPSLLKTMDRKEIEEYLSSLTSMEDGWRNLDKTQFSKSINDWYSWGNPIEKEYFNDTYGLKTSDIEEQKERLDKFLEGLDESKEKNQVNFSIIDYINKNYTLQDFCMENLCSVFGFSAQYITRVIKKNTGLSFSNYVTELRIEKAKEIMRQPQSRINEVARDVGYSYSSYFTKVFSQKEGITPSEWKKNNT